MYPKLMEQRFSNLGGINEKSSEYTLDITQFQRISNMDFNVPNALSKRPGSTQGVFSGTTGAIIGIYEFQRTDGFSQVIVGSQTALFFRNAGNTLTPFATGFSNGQPYDFVNFVNKLWIAQGQTFLSWTGQTLRPFQLPCPPAFSVSATPSAAPNALWWGVTMTGGQVFFAYAYLRDEGGYLSPAHFMNAQPAFEFAGEGVYGIADGVTLAGMTTPSGYGITALAIYAAYRLPGVANEPPPEPDFRFVTFLPVGTTIADFAYDAASWSVLNTGYTGSDFCFNATYTPKYIELNQNRMFFAGFSNAPSTYFYSEVAQPELIEADNTAEVRTNDGDRIYGMKAYNNQLVIFKEESFHRLIGDSEENFQLIEITAEYGALSNKAIVEFLDKLAFLDQKGVVIYNGANWDLASTAIETTMRRMNLSAAREKAVGTHYDMRNQIWFGIPVDGSSTNNLTVVYDYLVNAWTFIEGFHVASMATFKAGLNLPSVWRGDYSGRIHYHGTEFFSDNGATITCYARSRWEIPDGANVTNCWRRLFFSVNPIAGITHPITFNLYADFDESTVRATFTVYQNVFQTREEFGVPAKSFSFDFTHQSASLPLVVPGYAIARRFLRNV